MRSFERNALFSLAMTLCFFLIWGCSDRRTTIVDNGTTIVATESLSIVTPVRLAGYSGAMVLVSDYDGHAILKMRLTDQSLIGKISIPGKPTGLAWTTTEVFVGNETSGNVEVYDLNSGLFLRRMGLSDRLFQLPNGVAIDADSGLVFAVDTAAGLIKQFHLDGTSAGADLGIGSLSKPTALAVDSVNKWLYVSDFGEPMAAFGDTPAIHIVPYGTSIPASLRIEGTDFDFDRPQGLALNQNHRLFVAESVAGKVLVFDVTDLSPVKPFPAIGSGDLRMPLDVFVDAATDDLYVTSSLDSAVVLFPGGGA